MAERDIQVNDLLMVL